jgi:hypothetical protein
MPGGGDVIHKLRIARQVAAKDFFQPQQGADASSSRLPATRA